MSKNLVMGVAVGYDWNALEPFVTSFTKNCPSADLVLFVDNISEFTRRQITRMGGGYRNIPAEYKSVMIINARWKMYLDFLEAHGENYAQVLVADTRDVICQGDVFAEFDVQTNWLGYTTEVQTIGRDKVYNYRWIEIGFGKAEADKLAVEPLTA